VFPGHVFGTVQKPLAKRGAQALFRGIWKYCRIDMEFQSFYELEKLENHFYLHFGCGNGTLVVFKIERPTIIAMEEDMYHCS